MTKLEKLKRAFAENGLDTLDQLAHHCYCMLELGNAYRPTVDMLDDLYAGFVSGGINGCLSDFGGGPNESEKFSQEAYVKLLYSLVELGTTHVFPFNDWLKQNPESEHWAIYIERGLKLENEYLKDPETWLIDFREKLIKK